MSFGPFEWKQGLFRKSVRVETSEESITFLNGPTCTVIPYTEIRNVYFYHQPLIWITRSVVLQIVSHSGQKISLSFGGLAFTMQEHFVACKKAIIAFLDHYNRVSPGANVVLGFPPSKSNAVLWGVLTAGALGYTFFAMWREGMMATLLEFMVFTGLAIFMFLFMARSFRRNTGAKRKSALDLFEDLSG